MEPGVLVKAFGLLEVLGEESAAIGLGDAARRAQIAKPTAHRILNSLVDLGYVDHIDGGRYRLSRRIHALAVGAGRWLLDAADPHLNRLHLVTGETVNLGVMRQHRVVYLRVIESRHPLRRIVEPGAADPVHSTALGRAILAHLSADKQNAILNAANLSPNTPHTLVTIDAIREKIEDVRRIGYAQESDETDLGVTCIGAPLFTRDGVAAAISISVPSVRAKAADHLRLASHVVETARAISESLKLHSHHSKERETS